MKENLKKNNNQKQVIFLICSPLNTRDFERLGIKNWIDNGWKVKVFDISILLDLEFLDYARVKELSIDFEGLIIFNSIREVLSMLRNFQYKLVFIDCLGFSIIETKIRKIASAHGVLVQLRIATIPELKNSINILNLFRLIINPFTAIEKIIFFIKNQARHLRDNRYFPYFFVVSGTQSMSGINDNTISIIKAHNFD